MLSIETMKRNQHSIRICNRASVIDGKTKVVIDTIKLLSAAGLVVNPAANILTLQIFTPILSRYRW